MKKLSKESIVISTVSFIVISIFISMALMLVNSYAVNKEVKTIKQELEKVTTELNDTKEQLLLTQSVMMVVTTANYVYLDKAVSAPYPWDKGIVAYRTGDALSMLGKKAVRKAEKIGEKQTAYIDKTMKDNFSK